MNGDVEVSVCVMDDAAELFMAPLLSGLFPLHGRELPVPMSHFPR